MAITYVNLPLPLVAPLCLVSLPTMNVHWLLVLSGDNCTYRCPVSLLITPQFQLAKFPFLDGEFVHVHFKLQWSWGSVSNSLVAIVGDGFKG